MAEAAVCAPVGALRGLGEVLAVRGLAKRFGQSRAVVDVSLDLAPAEVLGFVGPNGAGKTTTLRILAGLLRRHAGAGHVLGHDVMAAGRAVGRLVGYMPQRLALYPELSVTDNLRFRAEVYELPHPARVAAAAIEDFELGPFRGQRASSLSGGWARRLQLAAALIHSPSLVLLDEPTAGLDAESRQDVWRRIAGLAARGDSVIINTHDLADAEQCTRVALFSRGRVLALGDPRALAEGAAFQAMLISGGDVHGAAHRFDALDGVIATYVQGQRLRVLMHPRAMAGVRSGAEAAGLEAEDTPNRLEDAAFVLVKQSLPAGGGMSFHIKRCLAVARVESLELIADRAALVLIFVLPIFQILLYGYAITLEPRNVPLVIATDEPRLVAPAMDAIRSNPAVTLLGGVGVAGTAEKAVESGRALIGVEVGRDPVTRGVQVRIIADAGDPAEVRPVVAALDVGVWRKTAEIYAEDQTPSVDLVWLHDPGGKSAWDITPGLVGTVVMITMLFLGALTLVRERERGSWESLLATPVRPAEALVGKLAPYMVIGVVQTICLLGIVHALFGVPLPPATWALVAATPLFVGSYLVLGFAFSALAQTQIQAVQASAFSYLPSILLSGFLFPFNGMPAWAQAVGEAIPLTHYIRATRDVLLRGEGPMVVWAHMAPVLAFTIAAFAVAMVCYRRRLD